MKIINTIFIGILIIFNNLKNTNAGIASAPITLFLSQNLIKDIASENLHADNKKNGLKSLFNQSNNNKIKIHKKTTNKYNFMKNCPNLCSCQGLSVDCSYRSLISVPENIPKNTVKL
jgi:hypothetical protein